MYLQLIIFFLLFCPYFLLLFYFPAFAMLGEQAVLNKEIYITGDTAQDNAVFGYQERWAEYRYKPSQISGLFKSTSAGTIDIWHLAQRFTSLPTQVLGDSLTQRSFLQRSLILDIGFM
jgi:hypothetical protein